MFPMQNFSPLPSTQRIVKIVRDKTLAIMKKGVSFLVTVALMALASSLVSASDPSPLQDTCVAIAEPKNAGIYIISPFFTTLFH